MATHDAIQAQEKAAFDASVANLRAASEAFRKAIAKFCVEVPALRRSFDRIDDAMKWIDDDDSIKGRQSY